MVHLFNTYKIKEVRLIMVRNKLYLNSCLTSLTFVISAIVVKDRLSTSPQPYPSKTEIKPKRKHCCRSRCKSFLRSSKSEPFPTSLILIHF